MIPVEAMQSELILNNNRVARRALERIGSRDHLGVLETFCMLQRVNPGDDASLVFHVVGYEASGQPMVDTAFDLLVKQDLELARGLLSKNRLILVALFGGVNTRWIPVPDEAIGMHFRAIEANLEPIDTSSRASILN
ncbi:MAG: hypothetical protein HC933_00260 [Pleurocapsa sp. SU_196_0]|nr:hypothetical protein [Pleurocapsa sp. SU_196_0]